MDLNQNLDGAGLARELSIAIKLARSAGVEIMQRYGSEMLVDRKVHPDKHHEPVTEADRVANELIVSGLRASFSHDGILAEESDDDHARMLSKRVWMVDPIDGTSGFIAGDGDFAVHIGLAVAGVAVLGVVYQPVMDVLFSAVEGFGSWIERADGKAMRASVSTLTEPQQLRLAVSRSHRSPRMDRVVQQLGIRDEVARGSVGVKVGLIVDQVCDLYIHLSSRTKFWDTCAPEVILREAGGMFTDLFGQPLRYDTVDICNRNGIVATNGAAHAQVIAALAPLLAEYGRVRV